jgi:hypothetical protein
MLIKCYAYELYAGLVKRDCFLWKMLWKLKVPRREWSLGTELCCFLQAPAVRVTI